METQTFTTVDKSAWPRGPWDNEPDKIQWCDESTGLPCLIVRNGDGALCGYVGVGETHPWYGVDYDDCRTAEGNIPEVHGDLTYSDENYQSTEPSRGVSYVDEGGNAPTLWWLGFDCAHSGDQSCIAPEAAFGRILAAFFLNPVSVHEEVYRTVEYVQFQMRKLAEQAKCVEGSNESHCPS